MGIHPAPSYANIFMAQLDQIVKLANTYKITDEGPLKTWKRFFDDCFGIWTDSIEKLYQFLDEIILKSSLLQNIVLHFIVV